MKQKLKKKLLAGILCACMIFQTAGAQPIYAAGDTVDSAVPLGTSTMCAKDSEFATDSNAQEISNENIAKVQALLDALPTLEALQAITDKAEQKAIYTDLQTAYDAYEALTKEEQDKVLGTEVFESLFAYFNSMTETLAGELQTLDLARGSITINADNVTGFDEAGNAITMTNKNGYRIIQSDKVTPTANTITVNTTARVELDGISISGTGQAIQVTGGNTLTLVLADGSENIINRTTANQNAVIQVTGDNALIIGEAGNGTGSLHITGTYNFLNVGIGGGYAGNGVTTCGDITIHNGKITVDKIGPVGIGECGHWQRACPVGQITIDGGTVDVTGGTVGIGLSSSGELGGIAIKGGTVKATGTNGVAIGICSNGSKITSNATIEISGGIVTAEGYYQQDGAPGNGADIGIDTGEGNSIASLSLTGGSIEAVHAQSGLVTDGTTSLYQLITANPGGLAVKVDGTLWTGQEHHEDGNTYLLLTGEDHQITVGEEIRSYTYDASKHAFSTPQELKEGEALDISYGDITIIAGTVLGYNSKGEPCYSKVIGQSEDHYLKITGTSTEHTILVNGDTPFIELEDTSIDVSAKSDVCAFTLTNGADASVRVTGTNTLKSGYKKAGLSVNEGNALLIVAASQGALTAQGGTQGAGIGGDSKTSGGRITIEGGTIQAFGKSAAGIGGGSKMNVKAIQITGGVILADSISGDYPVIGSYDKAGTVSICGGQVTCRPKFCSGFYGIKANHITVSSNALITLNSDTGALDANETTLTGGIIRKGKAVYNPNKIIYDTKVVGAGTNQRLPVNMDNLVYKYDLSNPSYVGKVIIEEGVTFTIPSGITLTNDGNLYIAGNLHVEAGGTLTSSSTGKIYQSGEITGAGTIAMDASTRLYSVSDVIDTQKGSSMTFDSGVETVEEGQGGATAFAKAGDTVTFTITPQAGTSIVKLPTVTAGNNRITVTKSSAQDYGSQSQALSFSFTMPASPVSVDAVIKSMNMITVAEGKENVTGAYSKPPVALEGISTSGDGTLTYSVSNSKNSAGETVAEDKIITVAADGTVTMKQPGTATITLTMAETNQFHEAKPKTITFTVEKGATAPNMPANLTVPYTTKTVGAVSLDSYVDWAFASGEAAKPLIANAPLSVKLEYVGADAAYFTTTTATITITRLACTHPTAEQEVRNTKKATCTAAGYTGDTYCKDCEEVVQKGTTIDALGHSYTSEVTKAPTDKETGVRTYTCSRCGDTYTEMIPIIACNHPEARQEVRNTKTATCTVAGYTGDTYCNDCGVKLYTGTTITALGHSYSSKVTKHPTTIEEGIMTYTCSRCSDSYTRSIDKLPSDESGNAKKPYIKGENGNEGWDVIKNQTGKEEDGDKITVEMNGTTILPSDIVESIRGKDVTLVLDMGDGISWAIHGKDVTGTNLSDIDLKVSKGTSAIPVDVINEVTGEKYSMQISLAYEGEFGFKATLSINMDKKNAGRYASLFYYNEAMGKLEFMNTSLIGADGNVALSFTHASDYTIVVEESTVTGSSIDGSNTDTDKKQPTKDNKNVSPATGNNNPIWNYIWVVVIGGMIMMIGLGTVIVKQKKEIEE